MSERILALGFERATNDVCRSRLLGALIRFAETIGDDVLKDEAKALLPTANPFRPPQEWQQAYFDAFVDEADEECGTYEEDKERYSIEYWQMMTDEERSLRMQFPAKGREDGKKDAQALNDCSTREPGEE